MTGHMSTKCDIIDLEMNLLTIFSDCIDETGFNSNESEVKIWTALKNC